MKNDFVKNIFYPQDPKRDAAGMIYGHKKKSQQRVGRP
ncbi:MAG: hypothetical protein ACI9XO_003861 [Paraglaciecola sp.]|jgi:hypothetical protein